MIQRPSTTDPADRWPVTAEQRKAIVEKLMALVTGGTPKEQIAASKALIAMVDQDRKANPGSQSEEAREQILAILAAARARN